MGATDLGPRSSPVHAVTIGAFEIDVTEVTVGQYSACVDAGICRPARQNNDGCNWGLRGREDHPINCVGFEQAQLYCGFVGKRLPLEQEWEYAARGNDFRKFPWGNHDPERRHVCALSVRRGTCRVGRFPMDVSPFGVRDLGGNVMEWTESLLCDYRAEECEPGHRVRRGGSFSSYGLRSLRTARRVASAESSWSPHAGFRCAR
jgi:formylglycine-generating enzyme required for sulfatase activity